MNAAPLVIGRISHWLCAGWAKASVCCGAALAARSWLALALTSAVITATGCRPKPTAILVEVSSELPMHVGVAYIDVHVRVPDAVIVGSARLREVKPGKQQRVAVVPKGREDQSILVEVVAKDASDALLISRKVRIAFWPEHVPVLPIALLADCLVPPTPLCSEDKTCNGHSVCEDILSLGPDDFDLAPVNPIHDLDGGGPLPGAEDVPMESIDM